MGRPVAMKRGFALHRKVQCSECGYQWPVVRLLRGKVQCPRCQQAVRAKSL